MKTQRIIRVLGSLIAGLFWWDAKLVKEKARDRKDRGKEKIMLG